MKLNVGCGKDIKKGRNNLDKTPGAGVDTICDVDNEILPFKDNKIKESLVSHLLEHLHNPLFFMEELWRVTKPNGTCHIRVPHGASDEAWVDQTHVRPYFPDSFGAFGQPFYNKADYGYRADWEPRSVTLRLKPWAKKVIIDGTDPQAIIESYRNAVAEMEAVLIARHPIRAASEIVKVEVKMA